jgi:glucosylglycerol 3-phosphatase
MVTPRSPFHASVYNLHQAVFSLAHAELELLLATTPNVLIVQDLDGVCMGLVNDPLQRSLDPDYVLATQQFDGHFYVLTNGEHEGQRGVNRIVERSLSTVSGQSVSYLPGLAAGGVQWQDRDGQVSHPDVSSAELAFLRHAYCQMKDTLRAFLIQGAFVAPEEIDSILQASVLDNVASPTVNLNTLYSLLGDRLNDYVQLQQAIQQQMEQLLHDANQQGLSDAFFIHYAPNLGRDETGHEIPWLASAKHSGTTDFQFMLKGAIKEAGVLWLLNHYYYRQTGHYPLGEDFQMRQVPQDVEALVSLVKEHFNPQWMPRIVGVGDTVNSQQEYCDGAWVVRRGGSDRNFLLLIQQLGEAFDTKNITVYVDSSHGEVKNRRPLKLANVDGALQVLEGPCDPRDLDDPLRLNVIFPRGHEQYCTMFKRAAQRRVAIR